MVKFDNPQDEYIIARWMYSIGEPIMDDTSYNKIHKALLNLGELPEYTSRSWSSDPCPKDLLTKYGLQKYIYEITLTDKTESIATLDTMADVLRYYRDREFPLHLSMKIDGFNTQPTYYNGSRLAMHTRGRIHDALDISEYLQYLPEHIDIKGEVRIAGELALSDSAFNTLRRLYADKGLKSQRNSVRSALANTEVRHLLTFLPFTYITEDSTHTPNIFEVYETLERWGFQTPKWMRVDRYEDLEEAIATMGSESNLYEFKTDGLVISSKDGGDLRAIRVGAWAEPVYASIITGFEDGYGPSRMGVKVVIEPTHLEGSTQTQVNITNHATTVNMRLYPGTPIAFRMRSQAIAHMDEAATRMLRGLYDKDPVKTTELIRSGEIFL